MYFALKQPKCFSALHTGVCSVLQLESGDLDVLSSQKHFLHHQFCFAQDGQVAESKQAGDVGHENKFPCLMAVIR